ncbi:MAG: hypothetical protein II979_04510 [Clostridia bacterium]|nr:hypothetical protein [Clostridia bacterium]
MERFLSLVLLGMLLAQVFVLPGVLWIAGWLRGRRGLRRSAVPVLAVCMSWVLVSSVYPPMVWPGEIGMERREAAEIIRPVAAGEWELPVFVPVLVTVEECREDFLRWRTDYLPFGWTEHVWAGEDGAYEMTEPLMGW